MDLTTLTNAKAWLSLTGTTDDALLTRLISAVSASAQSYMGRIVASASYTATRNGNGRSVIAFPDSPVTAVTSVTVDGTAIPARTSVTGSGYSFGESLLFLIGYVFTKGVANVQLVYTGGYVTTPLDLEQAVLDIVAYKYRERDRIGQGSKILQGETITFLRDVPAETMRVLNLYQRVVQP